MRLHYNRKKMESNGSFFFFLLYLGNQGIFYLKFHQVTTTWKYLKSEFHSALLHSLLETGSVLLHGLCQSFQFSKKALTCESNLACRHLQHCTTPHRLIVMKSFSERKFSKVGKQLNRTFSSFQYQNSCFFVCVCVCNFSRVRKIIRFLSLGFRFNVFVFTEIKVPAK